MDCKDSLPLQNFFHARYRSLSSAISQVRSALTRESAIADGGEKCGKITSSTSLPNGKHAALGYVRCRSRGVQVELAGKQVLTGLAGPLTREV